MPFSWSAAAVVLVLVCTAVSGLVPISTETTLRTGVFSVADAYLADVIRAAPQPAVSRHSFHVRVDFAALDAAQPALYADGYLNMSIFMRHDIQSPPECASDTSRCHSFSVHFPSSATDLWASRTTTHIFPATATSAAARLASCAGGTSTWRYFRDLALPLPAISISSQPQTFIIAVDAPVEATQRSVVGVPDSCPPTEIAFTAETLVGVSTLVSPSPDAAGPTLAASGAAYQVAPLLRLQVPDGTDPAGAAAVLQRFLANDTAATTAVIAAGGETLVAIPWLPIGWRPRSRPEVQDAINQFLKEERPNEEIVDYQHYYGVGLARAVSRMASASAPASWSAVSATMRPRGFGCVIDTLPSVSGRAGCVIPLVGAPERLNVSVLLEEGADPDWPARLNLTLIGASGASVVTVKCATPVALGRCGPVAACALEVPASGFTELVVVLPQASLPLQARTLDTEDLDECAFGTGVVVDFDYRPIPTVACTWPTEFTCANRQACVSAHGVCDGVVDCFDGSDEVTCDGTLVAQNATLPSTLCAPAQTLPTQVSLAECLGAALSIGGPSVFGAVSFTAGTCALFLASCVSAAVQQAAASGIFVSLSDAQSTDLHLLNGADVAQLRRVSCTSTLSCLGRGTAVLRTSLGPVAGTGCHCRCDAGFEGADCGRFRSPTNQVAIRFATSPAVALASLPSLRSIASDRSAVPLLGRATLAPTSATSCLVTIDTPVGSQLALRAPFANGTEAVVPLVPTSYHARGSPSPLQPRAHCRDLSALQGQCFYDMDLSPSAAASVLVAFEVYAPHQLDELRMAAYDAAGTQLLAAGTDRCDVATSLEFTDTQSGEPSSSCVRRVCTLLVPRDATRLTVNHVLRQVSCVASGGAASDDPSRPRVLALVDHASVVPATLLTPVPATYGLVYPSTGTAFIAMCVSGGLCLFCIALILYFAYRDVLRIRSSRSFNSRGNRRAARVSLHTTLATWAFRNLPRVERYGDKPFARHYDRIAVLGGLLFIICVLSTIASGAFWLFPILPPTAPHVAVVTIFDSEDCGALSGTTASPMGMFAAEAWGGCDVAYNRVSDNKSSPLYLAAECQLVDGGTATEVTLHSDATAGCRLAAADVVRAGTCVRLSTLRLSAAVGPASNFFSAMVQCVQAPSDDSSGKLREISDAFNPRPPVWHDGGVGNGSVAFAADGYTGAPWSGGQGQRVLGSTAGRFYYRFIGVRHSTGDTVVHSSHFPARLVARAVQSPAAFGVSAFQFPGERIVSQQSEHFYLDGLRNESVAWATEATIADDTRSIPVSSIYDLAVGDLFNDPQAGAFRRPQLRSRAAMRDVLLFPNVAGSVVDVGRFELPAVGFFLRASVNTTGFVFVLGDDVRVEHRGAPAAFDGTSRGSADLPLLDRLFDVVENGMPGPEHLNEAGLAVSLAVYVNGPLGTLSVHAMPANGSPHINAVFDLGAMGRGRVFGNSWHHITLKFLDGLVEILVDGEANKISAEWNACAQHPLQPVTVRDNAQDVRLPIPEPYRAVVYPRGAMYVGALNAGLHGLQFYSSTPFKYELNAHSTRLMAQFLGYSTQAYTYLGFYLLFIALTLMFTMITGVVSDFFKESDEARKANLAHARSMYFDIFDIDEQINTIAVGGEEYTALTLKSAVSITGLETDTFALVLEEVRKLAFSAEDSRADLLAFLWTQGKKNFDVPQRLADVFAEWRDVESGELSQDGIFTLPTELWEQLVRQHDGEVVRRRAIRVGAGTSQATSGGGNMQQLRGLRALRGAKSGTGRGTSTASSSGSSSLVQMLLPVTLALQTVAVYSDNWKLPDGYLGFIGDVLKYISFDFLTILPNLDVVYASSVLFGIALVIFLTLLYYAVADHRLWLSVAANYVIRRDSADRENVLELAVEEARARHLKRASMGGAKATPGGAKVPKEPSFLKGTVMSPRDGAEHQLENNADDSPDAVEDWMLPLFRYIVPSRVSVAIDQYADGARASNQVTLEADDLLPAEVKGDVEWVCETKNQRDVEVGVVSDPSHRRVPLLHVGCKCPHHTDRWLGLMLQSNVSALVQQCFVVQSGKRCGNVMGKMYTCGYRYRDGTVCPYALCADHAKMTLPEFMVIMGVTAARTVQEMGVHGLLAFAVVSLINVVYFPVINIGMQFLTCDARFQCAFPTCWEQPDSGFYLMLIFVIIVLLLIGVGTPLALFVVLWTRRRVLYKFFYHREYHRFYLATDDDTIEYGESLLKQQEEDNEIDDDEEDAVFRIVKHFAPNTNASLARVTMTTVATSVPRLSQVSFDEWERYLGVDASNLFPLYYMLEFEWMFLPPLILLHKAAILAPNVLMEDESLPQFVLTAVVETVFAIFVFWTQPYLNPWVDTIYRAGSVHNIGLLGLISYSRALAASGDSEDLDIIMITWTAVYLGFVVVLLVATVLVPVVGIIAQQVNVGRQMERVGMRTIDLSSLFLNPLLHDDTELTEEEAEAAAGIHDASSDSEDDEGRRHAQQSEAAKEQATKTDNERQLARVEARRAKLRATEQREKRRASAVEKTRVMALEDV